MKIHRIEDWKIKPSIVEGMWELWTERGGARHRGQPRQVVPTSVAFLNLTLPVDLPARRSLAKKIRS